MTRSCSSCLARICRALEVPLGVFDAKTARRLGSTQGMSVAVRPRELVEIRRGAPIARLVPLHADTIKAKATFVPPDTDA